MCKIRINCLPRVCSQKRDNLISSNCHFRRVLLIQVVFSVMCFNCVQTGSVSLAEALYVWERRWGTSVDHHAHGSADDDTYLIRSGKEASRSFDTAMLAMIEGLNRLFWSLGRRVGSMLEGRRSHESDGRLQERSHSEKLLRGSSVCVRSAWSETSERLWRCQWLLRFQRRLKRARSVYLPSL